MRSDVSKIRSSPSLMPPSTILVVDEAVLERSGGNYDFYRFLKDRLFDGEGIYLWSEWESAYRKGEITDTEVGFVLTEDSRDALGNLLGREGRTLHWAKRQAHDSLTRFWVVPYHRLSKDVELLGQVMRYGYGSLSNRWLDYIIDAVLQEVDERPIEDNELDSIQHELDETLDLFIQA